MMAFHFIAVMSHYSDGRRIAWHYSDEGKLDKEVIQGFLKRVRKKCGEVQLGIHKLATDSQKWDSVLEKDSFFKDVFQTRDIDTFIEMVIQDQELSAADVSKFILSVSPSSHLKLQKLIYFSYAEFLLRTGIKLFKEPIVAFKYGPVVESVFHKYKVHGSSVIDYKEDETICYETEDLAITPSFMKLASSEHGIVALECILKALKQYGEFSAGVLVEKTHQSGGPWDRVYKEGWNCEITDDVITQYHQVIV
ncbi:Panacea domain-containing protein [Bacillus mycoides]|uniref:Panacea domain-containing protein n=1 Tax=Bacillus mycoides TaxID=1405 RepID=UPI0024BDC1DF|nr:type II toxin-antitoxin system antitoxin SocA domain-containing protein [Bacillus mycoides]